MLAWYLRDVNIVVGVTTYLQKIIPNFLMKCASLKYNCTGLEDARNTARLAHKMMIDGCVLTITKTLNTAVGICDICCRSRG